VPSRPGHRRAYIDSARGIAVLLMIEAHTLDAWTRSSAKHGDVFRDATILGGFAAPLFLWLAGLAVVLSASRTAEKTGSKASAVTIACTRGLEIFILAFLFRLQAFIVSPGSYTVTLFRVDILNVMGPAMVATALVWALSQRTVSRVALFAALATMVAMVTPVVRLFSPVGRLPTWIQWYIRPSGDYTTFTLFPWAGFVFAGGAVGALVAAARGERTDRQLHAALVISGTALIALGFYTSDLPSIYRASSFWTSSPTWFAMRVGIVMVTLSVLYTVDLLWYPVAAWGLDRLAFLGRASLFIYWIHVELVYGYATWPIRRRLPLWGTACAYLVFCVLMYHAVVLRDRVVGRWRAPRGLGSASQAVTA